MNTSFLGRVAESLSAKKNQKKESNLLRQTCSRCQDINVFVCLKNGGGGGSTDEDSSADVRTDDKHHKKKMISHVLLFCRLHD